MWFFLVVGALWLIATFTLCMHLRNARHLPEITSDGIFEDRVSVVFAARDEVERVEQTVRRLLEHTPPVHEIIAVDDRSTDGTGETLDRIALGEPRLRVIHVKELPERWLGKTNALHLGGTNATGDWILFTDADVWIASGTIPRVLAMAKSEKADMICLLPSTAPKHKRSIIGDGFVLGFAVMLVDVFSRVNSDDPTGFAGVGAFNFVRTDLYRSFGGHEKLRLEVADDAMFGVLVRRAGGRIRAYIATENVECDYASGPVDLLKRLRKNHFAILRFNVLLSLSAVAVSAVFWLGAVVGPFVGGPAGYFAAAGMLSMIVPAVLFARKIGISFWSALLIPLALPFLGIVLLNSTITTLLQRGIWWRDTFYPLEMLRQGDLDWYPRQRIAPESPPTADSR